MESIAFKMLFRRKGTASTILAIALLIALLASVNSLVNNINSQADALSRLAGVGKTYLVVSQNSTALADSKVDANIVDSLRGISQIDTVLPQKLLQASLETPSGNSYTVTVRGTDNVPAFFDSICAKIDGSYCMNGSEANIGFILSNLASVGKNSSVSLSSGSKVVTIQVVGVVESKTSSDTEIVVPLETADALSDGKGVLSFVQFSIKESNKENEVMSRVTQLLSASDKVVKTQQIDTFAQDINDQIVSFLNLWSFAVYAVVVAASYVVAARLIAEARFELAMFRTLGAKKRFTFELVFIHTIVTAFLGSVLGLTIGIAGAQVASTAIRWMWGNLMLSPFLDGGQALQIILLALGSAIVGCIYPAVKSAHNSSKEGSL
ncbi:MAG: ABC transporter permease [Candidatus Bathyarchaeota archaeon]|nr:ABC transporter permease [Candidatus Bathyarchaeota archaeon]